MKGVANILERFSLTGEPRKLPGKPEASPLKLYRLKFIKGNNIDSNLVTFSEDLPLEDLIKHAKQYCVRNSMRFVFLESAITKIQVEDIVE